MTTRFQTAIEARAISAEILKQLRETPYNRDLMRYFRNVEDMISKLGSLEVHARQTRNFRKVNKYIVEVEQAIDYLEKMILIAKISW